MVMMVMVMMMVGAVVMMMMMVRVTAAWYVLYLLQQLKWSDNGWKSHGELVMMIGGASALATTKRSRARLPSRPLDGQYSTRCQWISPFRWV